MTTMCKGLPSPSEAEKQEASKNRPVYQLPCRISNWNEDLFLMEEKLKIANYKRDHCMLLVQKMRTMFKKLLTPVSLASESPFVYYGRNYQLKACDLQSKLIPEEGSQARYGLYLSALMNERDIEIGTHFIHGCGVSASPDKAPCVRNVWIIEGCNGQTEGQPVYYGDDIFIRIIENGIESPLYLQCENCTIDDFGAHPRVRLTQSPDIYCRFKVYHWDPHLRHETTGAAFPPNARIIIQHTASGHDLAAEVQTWMPTFFGAECIVSCHTFRDSHRMETAENMWMVQSDVTPDISLFVRAAKGEDIPADMLIG